MQAFQGLSAALQVFELQPRYAGDVAGAAAALVGNLADVHEALSGAARRALKAPDAALATGLAGAPRACQGNTLAGLDGVWMMSSVPGYKAGEVRMHCVNREAPCGGAAQ